MRFTISLALLLISSGAGLGQIITTSAGNSTWRSPVSVAVDSQGNQYIANDGNNVIYKVDRLGAATVVAGTFDDAGYSGDGGLATRATLTRPKSVAVDAAGVIYIADTNNDLIRKVGLDGIITTFAGSSRGYSGDGGPAVKAQIRTPTSLTLDSAGNLFFLDVYSSRIRKVSATGIITTVAGIGDARSSGDGGPALLAGMTPISLTVSNDGILYFSDTGDGGARIRRIDTNGIVTTIAGGLKTGFSGDGGPATAATMEQAYGLAVDGSGNVYIAELQGQRVRKIAPNGIITTYAGTGRAGFSGDSSPAASAQLAGPYGLTVDTANNLYVADSGNNRIRKISPAASPRIADINAGQPSFLGKAGFSSNTYLEIYGMNLATTTRTWGGGDFNGPNAPTSLGGVSVTINGKPAFVYYISPTQINVNTPEDTATGLVQVVVTNSLGASNSGTVTRARLSPTLQSVSQFAIGDKQYVVAQTPDFKSFIGRPNMIAGVPFVPAKPGDTISLYALGCGPTNPVTQAGVVTAQAAPLALAYQISIGGVSAQVTFGGMVANSIGLYQFNVIVPNVPAGDQPISLSVDGVANAQNLSIVIGS